MMGMVSSCVAGLAFFPGFRGAFDQKPEHVLIPLNKHSHWEFPFAGGRLHGHVWHDGRDDGERGERGALSRQHIIL